MTELELKIDKESNRTAYVIDDANYLPLIIGGFMIARYATLATTMMPSIILERTLATKFISNYENVPRKWISCVGLILANVFATIVTVVIIFGFVDVVFPILFASTCALLLVGKSPSLRAHCDIPDSKPFGSAKESPHLIPSAVWFIDAKQQSDVYFRDLQKMW
ncbi:unnamed protein product [Caenorhabditis auriculariae]|uniref:Uncharacterized protein n=1 Tax=Caenorhabditis auriculariae TaxID=2777116 RepID=A0A8S1HT10_9PELO|nr:unnamed protein product [Caenorhabditis auriculariae]